MTRICLLSDTHGVLDPAILPLLAYCDEVWHAGDIGDVSILRQLADTGKTLRAVYGNIDGREVRVETQEVLAWDVEQRKVLMVHIGGYPGKYPASVRRLIESHAPDIFVCGHSHILKVMYDDRYHMLALNPGACGKSGFHVVRTLLQFTIDGRDIRDMSVVELGTRV
jgi:putative phosphoesterase